jgi:cell division protein FtsA
MSKSLIWAVDFGDQKVTALVAQVKPGGELALAGSAEVPAQGLVKSEFIHTGDVTECLVEVLRGAERSSGSRCRAIAYNFDDVFLESRFPVGSKTLAGEGQIRPSDVEQAVASARRFVGNFEKSIVYSGRIHFLIDGKDSVVNPVGVFGRQLEVGLHVLMAPCCPSCPPFTACWIPARRPENASYAIWGAMSWQPRSLRTEWCRITRGALRRA